MTDSNSTPEKQSSKISTYLIFLIPGLCLLFLFQNGLEGIIPRLAKPIFVFLNLSILAGVYLSFKNDKNPSCWKSGGLILLPVILGMTAVVLPLFFLPEYSSVDPSGKMIHYYSMPHPLTYCKNVRAYVEKGICLEYFTDFDCQECSIEDCLDSKI